MNINRIENTVEEWAAFNEEKYGETSSGWTNTYLCY
jgi:hypothetical protein